MKYLNIKEQIHDKISSPECPIAASTPNLAANAASSSGSSTIKQDSPAHCIAMSSRTLPRAVAVSSQGDQRNVDDNVFRYDFPLPPVDRKLKPRKSVDEPVSPMIQNKPQVDRRLKPLGANQSNFMEIRTLPKYASLIGDENVPSMPAPNPPNQQHKLQYIELDMSSPSTVAPPTPKTTNSPRTSLGSLSNNNMYVANPGTRHHRSVSLTSHSNVGNGNSCSSGSGVVYNYVDFVKTDAFKRILEDRQKKDPSDY